MKKTNINRILFINPPSEHILKMEMSENVIEEMGYYPPLGLLYLATHLRDRSDSPLEVKIVDCVPEKIDYNRLKDIIARWAPEVCAVTTFTPTIVDALLTCKLAREVNNDIKTIIGGHHVDSYPAEALSSPWVDFICKGEGEESLRMLVTSIREGSSPANIPGIGYKDGGRRIIDESFPAIPNLDNLPIPDRGLINNDLYTCTLGAQRKVATVMSSRGCPHQCTFCYCPTKKYRMRNVSSIIRELHDILKMGITEVFFFDDLFNVSTQRVSDISRGILDEGISLKWSFRGRVNCVSDEMLKVAKEAGCERIHFGIETSSDDRLKRIKKMTTVNMIRDAIDVTRRNGITTVGSFMIGLPGETQDEIYRTFAFMRELSLDYVQISVLMPYPNTELYRDGLERGIFRNDFWQYFSEDPIGRCEGFRPQVWTEVLSQEELFNLINVGYKEFYMRPAYIIKSLLKTRSIKELFSKAHAGFTLLKEIIGNK